jgi:hypothetical protein
VTKFYETMLVWMLAVPLSVLIFFIFGVLATIPTYLCWNYALVPAVTDAHLANIGWLQAFGLAILIKMIQPQVNVKKDE